MDGAEAPMTELRHTQITGIGSSLPENVVPNLWFESFVETDDEWIRDRTGIEQRHFVEEGESTASLATEAGRQALEAAGVEPGSIDLLIVATCSPNRLLPATAAFVQQGLGMDCPAFDLNAACAGFVYGVSVASSQIRAGAADRVLVIGAEVLSRLLNLHDRTTCVLFGDGAGAAVLSAAAEPGVIDCRLALDGSQAELLTIPAGASEEPSSPEAIEQARTKIAMPDGPALFRRAVTTMADISAELLEKAGVSPSSVNWVVAHQANSRIIGSVGRRLGIDEDRVIVDIAEVGNTSAASIPIALDRAWRSGKLQPGDLIVTPAFGAGFAWGASLIRWTLPSHAAV
ncbi:MAG TPA: beta-ketoacyl-ACP synthase III [Actinomycetota bacterium]|nr:beta-ketoacyl-ACP synthase III [Actinomycetota bacterium]